MPVLIASPLGSGVGSPDGSTVDGVSEGKNEGPLVGVVVGQPKDSVVDVVALVSGRDRELDFPASF